MSKQLWAYISITYFITWTIVFCIYILYIQNVINLYQLNILFCFGSLGPFISAIVTTLVAAIIFHLTNNIASAFDKSYIVATVSTGFVLLAIYLLVKYKPMNLSDEGRVTNYLQGKRSSNEDNLYGAF
jgi:hypothetical protein